MDPSIAIQMVTASEIDETDDINLEDFMEVQICGYKITRFYLKSNFRTKY